MEDGPSVFVIVVLIVFSAFFSLFDLALNACRKPRLQKETRSFYRRLMTAVENPLVLIFTCRLWNGILGILAVLLAGIRVMRFLETAQTGRPAASAVIALTALVLGAAFGFLCGIFPQFIVSRIAPEKIAVFLLPLMTVFTLPLKPFSSLAMKFTAFSRSALRLEPDSVGMTEDELRYALMEGEKSGIVESKERTMVEGVFYLGDRPVGAFMTHRSEVQWLDCNAPYENIRAKVLEYRSQKCFPVANGSPDEIVGTVSPEDIILDQAQSNPQGLRAIMKKAHFIPETMSALKAFESFKQGQADFLFVMDEYGGLAGIISIRALVEEIVGELSAPVRKKEPLTRQEDGSLLADGTINIDDAAEILSLTDIPLDRGFHTLAGFVLSLAEELPRAGDSFTCQGYRFLVKEMDGNRIDKVLISRIDPPTRV
ncbi:MAG: hemolysin family protein [Treponema sp.]|jgi:putative hemolysin|nr:hemolysin family protein [Treponema sp.]